MNDNKNINNEEFDDLDENTIIVNDMDTGEEIKLLVIADYEKDGNRYLAVIPSDVDPDADFLEYSILKYTETDGEGFFETIDDDDEADDIEDYFNDLLTREIDYDN